MASPKIAGRKLLYAKKNHWNLSMLRNLPRRWIWVWAIWHSNYNSSSKCIRIDFFNTLHLQNLAFMLKFHGIHFYTAKEIPNSLPRLCFDKIWTDQTLSVTLPDTHGLHIDLFTTRLDSTLAVKINVDCSITMMKSCTKLCIVSLLCHMRWYRPVKWLCGKSTELP